MDEPTTPRTAVVTGAARGIGAALARRLGAAGLQVAVLDLDAEAGEPVVSELRDAGVRALSLGADVSDEDAVAAAVARCADELGPPTVLVNNAGIIRDNLLFRMSTGDWDAVMGVHLRGAFLMTRACQAFMVQERWGRIVSVSSISAQGNHGQANYSAAKAGLEGMTRTLALELGPFGVTANAIAPGYIETDMIRQTAERVGEPYDQFVARIAEGVPVRRMGRPDDIAAAVEYFVGDDAGFVTGQTLVVAGGLTSA
ncbi:MAG: beta-ketoacyl-ACP reductase [Micrococcales bacterium 70-64]|mgnify:CR=1 FL=1|nr:3-oxoacyl-ACP reductase FabG [Leifsonia sp.]ODU63492.1 MAG: beta-ketoacyl-ACP reductase [Leifsonia sp. SCN 70-46]OJX85183.1 MAG: beta-ketoacyl-ACP reductase [Micrococcales bacterium 70-64]